MVTEKQVLPVEEGSPTRQTCRPIDTRSRSLARIMGILAVLLLAGDSAFGQFLVQPMILKKPVQPGKRYTAELFLENLDPQAAEVLTLSLVELTQDINGAWKELRDNDPNLGKVTLRSCKSWLTVPRQQIEVGAYQRVPFNLNITVPAGTRGFYFAAVMASTEPRLQNLNGIGSMVNVEVLVPVILEVQSQPIKHDVSLADVGLNFQAQTAEKAAASLVTVDVTNPGGTFSRLLPVVRIWGQTAGHWKEISEVKFTETAIMPGVLLKLQQDVGRPLASGPYRLEGFLFVDGRRANRIQREIQFKGDDRLAKVHGDAPIDIRPAELFVDAVPGSTRRASLSVVNGSDETVNVAIEFMLPEDMLYAQANNVRGEELGCVDWVSIDPAQFTLRGHSQRNVGILVKMPNPAGKYPSYYGTIRLRATYADGQPGGTREATMCVQNKQVAGTPVIGSSVLTFSETTAGRYLVAATFLNSGQTHFKPACEGVLTLIGAVGVGTVKRFLMTSEAYGQTGVMLPFESRTFSGVLDVSDVAANNSYRLTAILRWPGGERQEQRVVDVVEAGGQKTVKYGDMEKAGGVQAIKL